MAGRAPKRNSNQRPQAIGGERESVDLCDNPNILSISFDVQGQQLVPRSSISTGLIPRIARVDVTASQQMQSQYVGSSFVGPVIVVYFAEEIRNDDTPQRMAVEGNIIRENGREGIEASNVEQSENPLTPREATTRGPMRGVGRGSELYRSRYT